MQCTIQKAVAEDIPDMLRLIHELAEYERASEEVDVKLDQMVQWFHEGAFQALVARNEQEIVGMALFYQAYSTWKGKIVYLDDLVVREKYRKSGIGQKLWDQLVLHCRDTNAGQLRWHVLDWNDPAIRFYEKNKASLDPQWITGKLERQALQNNA